MLERRVLGRLLEVAVHLAGRREDALDAGGGGGRGEVLLDHLRKRRPLALLRLPPREHLDFNVGILGVGEVLLELVELWRRWRGDLLLDLPAEQRAEPSKYGKTSWKLAAPLNMDLFTTGGPRSWGFPNSAKYWLNSC